METHKSATAKRTTHHAGSQSRDRGEAPEKRHSRRSARLPPHLRRHSNNQTNRRSHQVTSHRSRIEPKPTEETRGKQTDNYYSAPPQARSERIDWRRRWGLGSRARDEKEESSRKRSQRIKRTIRPRLAYQGMEERDEHGRARTGEPRVPRRGRRGA